MNSLRRIFFLTGARSDYDLQYSVIRAVHTTPGLEAGVVVTAGQLSPFHGMGIDFIRQDDFPIVGCIESLLSSETWQGRALSFAHLTQGLTHLLDHTRPDVLFVNGDREEMLAGAIVGNFFGIPIAHAHGGDRCIASEIDEVLRPAISKLAHLHFTATEGHRQRLIQMGELPEWVWATGGTGLDRLREQEDISDEILMQEFGVDTRQPFFLLIQHPSPLLETTDSYTEMWEVLDGLLALHHPVFCSYPNYDPGNIGIRKAIDDARARYPNLIVYHNLPRDRFIALYRRCTAVVGNSSSIVIESGFLKVPGILVGSRQDFREVGANVQRVDIASEAVAQACAYVLNHPSFRDTIQEYPSIYGDGHAGSRIAEILATVELPSQLLRKMMPY